MSIRENPILQRYLFFSFPIVATVFLSLSALSVEGKLSTFSSLTIALLTIVVLYVGYKCLLPLFLLPEKKAILNLQGKDDEEIIKTLTSQVKKWIENIRSHNDTEDNANQEMTVQLHNKGREINALLEYYADRLRLDPQLIKTLFLNRDDPSLFLAAVEGIRKNTKLEKEDEAKLADYTQRLQNSISVDDRAFYQQKQAQIRAASDRRKKNIKNIKEKLEEDVTYAEQLSKHLELILHLIKRVLSEPSTGKAFKYYAEGLSLYINDQKIKGLIDQIVRLRPGISPSQLLSLNNESPEYENFLRCFGELHEGAISEISTKLSNVCGSMCPNNNKNPINILTFGYSNVIRRILKNCATRCQQKKDFYLYIAKLGEKGEKDFFLEQEELCQELQGYERIKVVLIRDIEKLVDSIVPQEMDRIMLGADNISVTGNAFTHFRGGNKLLNMLLRARKGNSSNPPIPIWICAESFKVKNISSRFLSDLSFLSPSKYQYLVTDAGVLEVQRNNNTGRTEFKDKASSKLYSDIKHCEDYWSNYVGTQLSII